MLNIILNHYLYKGYSSTEWLSSNLLNPWPRNVTHRQNNLGKCNLSEQNLVNLKLFPTSSKTCQVCDNFIDLPLKYANITGDLDFPNEENHAAGFLAYYHLNETRNEKDPPNILPLLKEKSFKCVHCLKSFRYRTSLFQHVCEGGLQKGFRCKECGKTLARKSSLIGHLRIHTGEKPFKCEHCGKAFTHKHHLHSHMHRHKE
ncbi:hypothetical protein CDAR_90182 [Caerostris darwini]|uniref:C2H2-type domain-containing protein n=1 Tax=Caerostris darwini TaxID=1538125 RepID=A0AAV4X338_9ARAC|nr:hypothetical protein CDAR_90182 [Caerostris darwini]